LNLRIVHTSDWHLGKILFGIRLTDKQFAYFENHFFPTLKELKPDLLIITGDIFDRPIPDLETEKLFAFILKKLFELKIFTIIIPGNHDSKRLTVYKEFLSHFNLLLIDNLCYFFSPFKFKNASFHILPYLSFYELKDSLSLNNSDEEITYSKLLYKAISQIKPSSPSFFIGHFAVENAATSGEEILTKTIGNEEVIPISFFSQFNIVLLGHIHKLQKIKNIYYAGSILPYNFSSDNLKKGIWFFELQNDKIIKEEKIFIPSTFQLVTIKGCFEEILRMPDSDEFIKIILKDSFPIFNAYDRLKEKFKNLVILEYEKDLNKTDFETPFAENTPLEMDFFDDKTIFTNFYKYIKNQEPSQEILSKYIEIVEELKKIKEKKEEKLWQ